MMSNTKLAIKRTLTFLLAFAMVVTSLYVAPVTAKADEIVEEVVEAAEPAVVEEVSEATQNDAVVNEEVVEETVVEENAQIEADKFIVNTAQEKNWHEKGEFYIQQDWTATLDKDLGSAMETQLTGLLTTGGTTGANKDVKKLVFYEFATDDGEGGHDYTATQIAALEANIPVLETSGRPVDCSGAQKYVLNIVSIGGVAVNSTNTVERLLAAAAAGSEVAVDIGIDVIKEETAGDGAAPLATLESTLKVKIQNKVNDMIVVTGTPKPISVVKKSTGALTLNEIIKKMKNAASTDMGVELTVGGADISLDLEEAITANKYVVYFDKVDGGYTAPEDTSGGNDNEKAHNTLNARLTATTKILEDMNAGGEITADIVVQKYSGGTAAANYLGQASRCVIEGAKISIAKEQYSLKLDKNPTTSRGEIGVSSVSSGGDEIISKLITANDVGSAQTYLTVQEYDASGNAKSNATKKYVTTKGAAPGDDDPDVNEYIVKIAGLKAPGSSSYASSSYDNEFGKANVGDYLSVKYTIENSEQYYEGSAKNHVPAGLEKFVGYFDILKLASGGGEIGVDTSAITTVSVKRQKNTDIFEGEPTSATPMYDAIIKELIAKLDVRAWDDANSKFGNKLTLVDARDIEASGSGVQYGIKITDVNATTGDKSCATAESTLEGITAGTANQTIYVEIDKYDDKTQNDESLENKFSLNLDVLHGDGEISTGSSYDNVTGNHGVLVSQDGDKMIAQVLEEIVDQVEIKAYKDGELTPVDRSYIVSDKKNITKPGIYYIVAIAGTNDGSAGNTDKAGFEKLGTNGTAFKKLTITFSVTPTMVTEDMISRGTNGDLTGVTDADASSRTAGGVGLNQKTGLTMVTQLRPKDGVLADADSIYSNTSSNYTYHFTDGDTVADVQEALAGKIKIQAYEDGVATWVDASKIVTKIPDSKKEGEIYYVWKITQLNTTTISSGPLVKTTHDGNIGISVESKVIGSNGAATSVDASKSAAWNRPVGTLHVYSDFDIFTNDPTDYYFPVGTKLDAVQKAIGAYAMGYSGVDDKGDPIYKNTVTNGVIDSTKFLTSDIGKDAIYYGITMEGTGLSEIEKATAGTDIAVTISGKRYIGDASGKPEAQTTANAYTCNGEDKTVYVHIVADGKLSKVTVADANYYKNNRNWYIGLDTPAKMKARLIEKLVEKNAVKIYSMSNAGEAAITENVLTAAELEEAKDAETAGKYTLDPGTYYVWDVVDTLSSGSTEFSIKVTKYTILEDGTVDNTAALADSVTSAESEKGSLVVTPADGRFVDGGTHDINTKIYNDLELKKTAGAAMLSELLYRISAIQPWAYEDGFDGARKTAAEEPKSLGLGEVAYVCTLKSVDGAAYNAESPKTVIDKMDATIAKKDLPVVISVSSWIGTKSGSGEAAEVKPALVERKDLAVNVNITRADEYTLTVVILDKEGEVIKTSGGTIEAGRVVGEMPASVLAYDIKKWYKGMLVSGEWTVTDEEFSLTESPVNDDLTIYGYYVEDVWTANLGTEDAPIYYSVDGIQNLTYTGKAQKPAVTVRKLAGDDESIIKKGYSVKYYSVATGKAGTPKNVGSYYAEVTIKKNTKEETAETKIKVPFEIDQMDIAAVANNLKDKTIVLGKSGASLATIKSFKAGGATLKIGRDYTYRITESSYTNIADSRASKAVFSKAGRHFIVINAKGTKDCNFKGEAEIELYVTDKAASVSNAKVSGYAKSITLAKGTEENEIKSFVVTMADKTVLTYDSTKSICLLNAAGQETNIEVRFSEESNLDRAGKVTVVLTADPDFEPGTGEVKYYGTKEFTYTIKKNASKTLKKSALSGDLKTLNKEHVSYDNHEWTLYDILTEGNRYENGKDSGIAKDYSDYLAGLEGAVLNATFGQDYKISYAKNINPGTASVIFEALPGSGWSGSFKQTFKIDKVDVTDAYDVKTGEGRIADTKDSLGVYGSGNTAFTTNKTGSLVVLSDTALKSLVWDMGKKTFDVATEKYVDAAPAALVYGTDFTVSQKGCKVGSGGDIVVTVKGKGKYAKSVKITVPTAAATASTAK